MDYFLPFAQIHRSAGARSGSLAGNVDAGQRLVQAPERRGDFPRHGKCVDVLMADQFVPFCRVFRSKAVSTASVIAVMPVSMVGFGTGANSGE